jgi:hypothetical protein
MNKELVMNWKMIGIVFSVSLVAAVLLLPQRGVTEQVTVPAQCVDEALCAKMLAFGKQAYTRGKYLDAKEYFRRAVMADPTSMKAWSFYDLASTFALAEKVEQNADLIAPGTSSRGEAVSTETPPPPKPAAPKKQEKPAFKIIDDEGC